MFEYLFQCHDTLSETEQTSGLFAHLLSMNHFKFDEDATEKQGKKRTMNVYNNIES